MTAASSFLLITLTFFFAINAIGLLPAYLSLVEKCPKEKRKWIALREMLFALGIMVIFNYFGQGLFALLGLTQVVLKISGGIVLFLIAIRLLFPRGERESWGETEPFIVPIATPLFAGPSVLAVIMIYAEEESSNLIVLGAIFVSWLASSIIFYLARPIYRCIGTRGMLAAERLMGLFLALISVQMAVDGIRGLAITHGGG